jgi:hypothetical protein
MAFCALAFFGASLGRASSSQINVTVINCAQDTSVTPSLRLVRWPNTGESANDFPVQVLLANPTEHDSVIITSNLSFALWDTAFAVTHQ